MHLNSLRCLTIRSFDNICSLKIFVDHLNELRLSVFPEITAKCFEFVKLNKNLTNLLIDGEGKDKQFDDYQRILQSLPNLRRLCIFDLTLSEDQIESFFKCQSLETIHVVGLAASKAVHSRDVNEYHCCNRAGVYYERKKMNQLE